MPDVHLFAPSASLLDFSNCRLHDHINRQEADDGEKRGVLIRLDAKGNYYARCGRADLRERVSFATVPHSGLSQETILAFAAGKPWAIEKVEGYGDVLPVAHVTYDAQDVWFGKARGKPVFAVLKRYDRDVADSCLRFLTRSGKFKLSQGRLNEIIHRPRLSEIWPRVFVQFIARDPFDAGAGWLRHLSATLPDDLPSAIAYQTVAAYMRGAWPPRSITCDAVLRRVT